MANEHEDPQSEGAAEGKSSTDYEGLLDEAQGKQVADPDKARYMADAEAPVREDQLAKKKYALDQGVDPDIVENFLPYVSVQLEDKAQRAGEKAGENYDKAQLGHQEQDPARAEAMAHAADRDATKAARADAKAADLRVKADGEAILPSAMGTNLIKSGFTYNRAESQEARADSKRAKADEAAEKAGEEYDKQKGASA